MEGLERSRTVRVGRIFGKHGTTCIIATVIIRLPATQVIIKNLKNKWESATKENVLNLNVNLLKTPERVIEYIVLHELCHPKIKEHSHHFWDLLHKFMPDYQSKMEWLRINGSRLV